MKTLISSLALLISLQIAAQPLLKTKTSSSVQPALNEVIQDYFKHFEGILGDTLSHSRGTITFESRVKLPGAISCVVSKYATPATYSWEAIMSEDEDFDSAQKKYDRYFKELNNAKFAPNGFEKYTL